MPLMVRNNDLIADKTYTEAHQSIANVTNAFLTLNGEARSSLVLKARAIRVLRDYYNNSAPILTVSVFYDVSGGE